MSDATLLIDTTATFETEGRLLQELGERLVSSADVALVELIKNAYDADAAFCWVSRSEKTITVLDDGHGITMDEFLKKWMRIATGGKQKDRFSRRHRRVMTGAKGIGRFAVRFLGRRLTLESVAHDATRGFKTKLTADFDWESIDAQTDLRKAEIPYRVERATNSDKQGTTLTISLLRDPDKLDFGRTLRTQVLGIVSPIGGLDRGRFGGARDDGQDPGFTLELPGHEGREKDMNLAETVLSHSYARVIIDLTDSHLTYTITHKDGRCLLKRKFTYESHLSKGMHADIRYFPRRGGMFQGIEVRGWDAWEWVHSHCGIGVVDHGFRIQPYGFEDDDWLKLQTDAAHNAREWRSALMREHFPIPDPAKDVSKEKANPMLYLPNFHQLVGAVFVESNQSASHERPTDLTPAINRDGFIENEAYGELWEIVRTGMELLALEDHKENRRLEKERADKAAQELRRDFREAIQYIQKLPSLTEEDKSRVTAEYTTLSKHLENVEEYYHDAHQRMDAMALLGVMAGFMTHESKALVSKLDQIVQHLQQVAKKDPVVAGLLPDVARSLEEFRGQVEYSALFIGSLQDRKSKPGLIPVAAQVSLVTERFTKFATDRNILVEMEIDSELRGPALPVAVYSGIVMNLYTNALKAVVGGELASSRRRIVFKAWNEPKAHILEVADNGIGIPPHLQKRIWDPLFTTTTGGTGNPLGSGMGLGLSLIKDIIKRFGGNVGLTDPPPGFSTCFKVQLPNV